ncbi:hypothetical protein SIAM614_00372 [Stappia aggregata IAM 12614]|uniref:Uncharacterized protein n=1 Tax=Roseibium aggregatum (strain ATCC 25650 / DSM 13394 / JCM 20685 / NBRC 16684 / NCIMB 2208 / IAM 12614 / B1) TaxID=384765 RepID=A0P2J7_ROSAI|nr:hypothetical protein SIAM614_00372 [Stappia aggregata IAM 12614] [Roseibium aggregatum IAM 12614]
MLGVRLVAHLVAIAAEKKTPAHEERAL